MKARAWHEYETEWKKFSGRSLNNGIDSRTLGLRFPLSVNLVNWKARWLIQLGKERVGVWTRVESGRHNLNGMVEWKRPLKGTRPRDRMRERSKRQLVFNTNTDKKVMSRGRKCRLVDKEGMWHRDDKKLGERSKMNHDKISWAKE